MNDVNFPFSQFIVKDIHAPFKYYKSRIIKHNKLWIAGGTTLYIKKKNKLYKKFCQVKDPEQKSELHKQYIVYKNRKTNLFRKSKKSHYKNLFEENKRNSFKILQGIKEIIDLNSLKINDSIVTTRL